MSYNEKQVQDELIYLYVLNGTYKPELTKTQREIIRNIKNVDNISYLINIHEDIDKMYKIKTKRKLEEEDLKTVKNALIERIEIIKSIRMLNEISSDLDLYLEHEEEIRDGHDTNTYVDEDI